LKYLATSFDKSALEYFSATVYVRHSLTEVQAF